MIRKIRESYSHMNLAPKIRWSYLVIMIPILGFVFFGSVSVLKLNHRYDGLISSVAAASEFSLDFQKDYDLQTYLVIVGNVTPEESKMDELLKKATEVVSTLEELTDNSGNKKTLVSISKYLNNLQVYKSRIEENLKTGNLYEQNMEIWQNDVQIVTALIRESMITYIHDETKELQAARDAYQIYYFRVISLLAVFLLLIFVFIAVTSYYIPIGITRKLRELCEVTDQISEGDLTVSVTVDGGDEERALSASMNTMIEKINELIVQVKEEQNHLRRSEFELLQSQINPHFLYNTLDAIMWLTETGERTQAVNMIRNLSDFFRASLNQGKVIVAIKEELMHVESYLEIQRMRYEDILDFEIGIPEELAGYSLPKLTLQPLVENALYHGIKNRRGGGKISLMGRVDGDQYILTVKDNGIGMSKERLSQVISAVEKGTLSGNDIFGLYNVNERIRLYMGEMYGLTIDSVFDQGTVVNIVLPRK